MNAFSELQVDLRQMMLALVQDRPYRCGMTMLQAFAVIDKMLQQQKLDPELVTLLKSHSDKCFEIATGAGYENTLSEMAFYNDADLQAAASALGNG